MDRAQLRQAVAAGQSFEYLFFWGHKPSADGRLGPTCLSQWYAAPTEEEGVRYPTAEHYMMAGKARLFGDHEALAALLADPDPGAAKRWGRRVRGYENAAWERARSELVVRGNVAKFGSDPRLRSFLLGTGEAVLVEASPRDAIWGIGMGAQNPEARDPLAWRGLNLLGFALMEARDRLR